MKRLSAIFAILIASLATAQQLRDEKIKEILEVTGTRANMLGMMDKMIEQQKSTGLSELPEEFWNEFKDPKNIDFFEKEIITLYKKYYTAEDIDALLKFYKTPIGKKMIQVTPVLLQESMSIGEKWGRDIAQKFFESQAPPPSPTTIIQ